MKIFAATFPMMKIVHFLDVWNICGIIESSTICSDIWLCASVLDKFWSVKFLNWQHIQLERLWNVFTSDFALFESQFCSNCNEQNGCIMPVQHRWCKTSLASLPSPLCCEDLYYPIPNPFLSQQCIWCIWCIWDGVFLHSAARTSLPPSPTLSPPWWSEG